MKFQEREILLIAPEILNPRSMPSVGVTYIGTYLHHRGLRVRIIDAQYLKADPVAALRSSAPTLVGIAVESRTIHRGLKLARIAKAHGHTTVLGGLHVSLIGEQILAHREVDYGIKGDGEVAVYQLLQALDGERALAEVSGLIYRDGPDGRGGEVFRRNPNTTEVADLDSLPFPDYRLSGIEHIPLYPLVTSRDCPYKCTFCTTGTISHGRFRPRSAASAVDEIIAAKERYGTRGVVIVDENFSFEMDRALEFCELMIEKQVNVPWTVFEGMRADSLTDEILILLKRAGCRWLFFGIETIENAVLKKVVKGSKLYHIQRAVGLAKKHGFKVGGYLIIGLPGSTFQKDMNTLHWALTHLDKATFWTAIPYLGTAMYRWVEKHGRILRQPTDNNVINTLGTMPFFETDDYPAGERKRAHAIACLRTGIHYSLEYLDFETRKKLPISQRTDAAAKRRLIEVAHRYDPSFLPHLVEGRAVPDAEDPVFAAVRAANEPRPEPLPSDMHGAMGTTIKPIYEDGRVRLPVVVNE